MFDVLWSNGRDLTGKTVLQRRDRLEQIIAPVDGIQVVHRDPWKRYFRAGKGEGTGGDLRKAKEQHLPPGKTLARLAKDQVTPPEASATRALQYAHSAGRLW